MSRDEMNHALNVRFVLALRQLGSDEKSSGKEGTGEAGAAESGSG
ncbi:hypothetical protein [Paraburkholderia sp. Tr-20389]|nr:hypothetical protein [Paraburkholderia sp. Tr-20389]